MKLNFSAYFQPSEYVGYDYNGVLEGANSINSLMRLSARLDVSNPNKEVFIITKLNTGHPEAKDVYGLAETIGIKPDRIVFTNNNPKSYFINQLGITLFYDDQMYNKLEIEANSPNCKVILVTPK